MYCFSELGEFADFRESIKADLITMCGKDGLRLFVAINEAVNNAIHHGNKLDTNKKVYLTITSQPEKIEIVIRDEGTGWAAPEDAAKVELLSENGRGLAIIEHCVDQYRFNHCRNELTLIKKKHPAQFAG